MIRVGCGVEIRHVTTCAGIRCVYITPLVTGETIARDGGMGSGKRVNVGMVKG